jgi:hypothetical protein
MCLWISPWLSGCLFARDISIIAERIFMDFNVGTFIQSCRHVPVLVEVGLQFWTLLENPYAYVRAS